MKIVASLALIAGIVGSLPALAQSTPSAKVVSSCGTVPYTYNVGDTVPILIDTKGNMCGSTAGAGPSPIAAAGIAPSVAGSSSSNTVAKASPGNLYGAYVTTGATAGYLMVFNAIAAPSNGATTAGIASGNLQECVVAPANTTTSISYIGAPPEVFTTGVTLVFSSTGCGTLTLSATAYLHGSAF